MRLLMILFFNISFVQAQESVVKLDSLANSNVYGKLVINIGTPHSLQFDIHNLDLQKEYGIVLYETGDCSNYYSQIKPDMFNKTDKSISPATGAPTIFLATTAVTTADSYITTFNDKHTWENTKVFNFSAKKKIFVLFEIKNFKTSDTGQALACGIHP
ncbi:MAG: hypothetical protein NDI63_00425 [Pseudobdellovibrio sp.]|nr:hypothetical protein [Pseudobdellovibrio sp.]